MLLNERPKCAIEECTNPAFMLFRGKWICGKCFIDIQNKIEKQFWEQIKENDKG